MLLEQFPFRAFEQHLFRREIAQQLVHIVEISLGGQELTRRYIEKSHTHFVTYWAAPFARRVNVIPNISDATKASSENVS